MKLARVSVRSPMPASIVLLKCFYSSLRPTNAASWY